MTFDVLSAELNPFQSHFLEASAGTGKTFAIEHVVARLIMEGDAPLLLEEIVVVTFTRAATRELKSRIYRNLKKIQADLLKGSSSLAYVSALLERGQGQEARRRLDFALLAYEKASIYTLHGFCAKLLKEFLLLGSDVEPSQVKMAVECWIEQLLGQEEFLAPYSPFQLKQMLNAHQKNGKRWVAQLTRLVLSSQEVEPALSYQELFEKFITALSLFPSIDLEYLPHLSLYYNQLKHEKMELWARVLNTKTCQIEEFDQLIEQSSFLEKMVPHNRKKRMVDSPDTHLLERIQQELYCYVRVAKDAASIQLHLVKRLKEKAVCFFEENDLYLPDDLLVRMQEALLSEEFVSSVQKKFKAAIIDEFQDTDKMQWAIIKTLFIPSSIVYLVGDPKQSIYAFRNADVYVYLEAKEHMPVEACKCLATNYRSSTLLVEGLNALFAKAQPSWMGLPATGSALEVSSVQAAGVNPAMDGHCPIVCFTTTVKKVKAQLFTEQVFPYLATQIASLHHSEGIAFHDMAVLVKDRFQGQALMEYLKSCQIPANLQRGLLITQTEAYHSLKQILQALYHLESVSAIKTALATPIIGWDERLLSLPSTSAEFLSAKTQLQHLHMLLEKEGFGAFFYALWQSPWVEERRQEQIYLDSRRLLELILAQERERRLDYLEYIERLEFDASADDPLCQVGSFEERGAVSIMTIHRSKGLEFDVVFALGLASRSPSSDLISIRRKDTLTLATLDPQDEFCQRALAEIDAEKMRLLYVALTRAKKKLYFPALLEEGVTTLSVGQSSAMEIFLTHLLGGKALDRESLIACLKTLPLIQVDHLQPLAPPLFACMEPAGAPLSPLVGTIASPRAILSFSSLAQTTHIASKEKQEPALHSIHSMPKGAKTGVLIHHLFEQILKKGWQDRPSLIEALIRRELSASVLEPWIDVIIPWVLRLFTTSLGPCALCDISPSKLLCEVEFLYPCPQGVMKGFADLFFEFENKYYILDWKTNYLGPSQEAYTQEAMAQAMREHDYGLQIEIYREALRRYVKLFDSRPFSECFGGALYYFVRGNSIFCQNGVDGNLLRVTW